MSDPLFDTQRSWLVEAPAGSGKTTVLVGRYLTLLSRIQKAPEEIVALTFTRKAAFEMQSRVLDYLSLGKQVNPPEGPFLQHQYRLAQAALSRLEALEIDVFLFPNRLHIFTFDEYVGRLLKALPFIAAEELQQLPFLTQSVQYRIEENPRKLYQTAVHGFLTEAFTAEALLSPEQSDKTQLIQRLLAKANSVHQLEQQLIQLLEKRSQWLYHLLPLFYQKQSIESTLAGYTSALWEYIHGQIIAFFAAHFSEAENRLLSEILDYCGYAPYPQGLSNLFLTKTGSLRKRFTQKEGFATNDAQAKHYKQALMQQFVPILAEQPEVTAYLGLLACAEERSDYTTEALFIRVLPQLLTHLMLVFSEQKALDFTQRQVDALYLLEQLPKEQLSLYLESQLQHLLVDECQDTSPLQYRMLIALSEHMRVEQGEKSIFLVGDPMQSIYGFREAELSLFITLKQQGLPHWPLSYYRLQDNYRSAPAIVAWNNQCFSRVFSHQDDAFLGTLAFSPSHPQKETEGRVEVLAVETDSELSFTQTLLTQITAYCTKNPNDTVAILAFKRKHLFPFIAALKQANQPFIAQDCIAFSQSIIIAECNALLQAVFSPSEALAWHTLFHSPWCGFSLALIEAIEAYVQKEQSSYLAAIATFLHDGQWGSEQPALLHFYQVWSEAQAARSNRDFVLWFEALWWRLYAYVSVRSDSTAHSDQEKLLEEWFDALYASGLTFQSSTTEVNDFIATVLDHKASESAQNAQIHLMTMHSAKGLEFDAVFMPHLEAVQRGASEVAPLTALLPLYGSGAEHTFWFALHDPLCSKTVSQYMLAQKNKEEKKRLFYVACTRAKKALFLYAMQDPEKKSMGGFWPFVADTMESVAVPLEENGLRRNNKAQRLNPATCKVNHQQPLLYLERIHDPFMHQNGHPGFVDYEMRKEKKSVLLPT